MSREWSVLPHESYSVTKDGVQYGIGSRDIWDQIPGAWNILQLVWSPEMESLLNWAEAPEEFPHDCGLVPYALGFALQRYSVSETWGDLAARTTPSDFLQKLSSHPECNMTILVQTIGTAFWTRAKAVEANYIDFNSNVVQGNFGGRPH